jgi:hypothetical protein
MRALQDECRLPLAYREEGDRSSFEGDFVDCLLDLVDDHVGELGALLAVQSLT